MKSRIYTMTITTFNALDCDICGKLVSVGQQYLKASTHGEYVFGRKHRAIAHVDCAAKAEAEFVAARELMIDLSDRPDPLRFDDADYCEHHLLICRICDPEATGSLRILHDPVEPVKDCPRSVDDCGMVLPDLLNPDSSRTARAIIDRMTDEGYDKLSKGWC